MVYFNDFIAEKIFIPFQNACSSGKKNFNSYRPLPFLRFIAAQNEQWSFQRRKKCPTGNGNTRCIHRPRHNCCVKGRQKDIAALVKPSKNRYVSPEWSNIFQRWILTPTDNE
ncbi:hypothetical protein NPIL_498471 [Nephila pilipes]|uniref:Uncharacterized protein n=1 Tax=Nephila pilipes TaxID=299642 RepID=A0A8X6MEH0_NEPPI|nr:hypothetical protein NPIL_498471 [Nephila pilipes]